MPQRALGEAAATGGVWKGVGCRAKWEEEGTICTDTQRGIQVIEAARGGDTEVVFMPWCNLQRGLREAEENSTPRRQPDSYRAPIQGTGTRAGKSRRGGTRFVGGRETYGSKHPIATSPTRFQGWATNECHLYSTDAHTRSVVQWLEQCFSADVAALQNIASGPQPHSECSVLPLLAGRREG